MTTESRPPQKSAVPKADTETRHARSASPTPGEDDDNLTIRGDPIAATTAGDLEKAQLENAALQAEGPASSTLYQGNDDFVEGGFEGWKVILGCALVSGPSIGG